MAGWYIFRKDDEAEEMYFIRSGSVEVCSADGKIVFVTLKKGSFFGEFWLVVVSWLIRQVKLHCWNKESEPHRLEQPSLPSCVS
jgi:hypothetical protein